MRLHIFICEVIDKVIFFSSIVAFVADTEDTKILQNRDSKKDFRLFKFVLNNADGCSVQCNVYDENIEKFEKSIVINEVILIML